MKEQYITITGMNHYYDLKPFKIGRRLKCIKDPDNDYDDEAIKVVLKHVGTVGYVANSVYTVIRGTRSAGAIAHLVNSSFIVEVMFITGSRVICKVVEGWKTDSDYPIDDEMEEEYWCY